MIVRVSAKLGKKIRVSPTESLPADPNPFADWSAHLFTADRVQYILMTNTLSLYSMVMYGKGVTDDNQFLSRMTSYMGEFIRDDGHAFIYERLIAPSSARVAFSKPLNRSVTGSMNELVWKHIFADKPLCTRVEDLNAIERAATEGGLRVGMQLTEQPSNAAFDCTVLRENMVLTLEPSLSYGDGLMMVHEENIVLSPEGTRFLTTRAAPELPVI